MEQLIDDFYSRVLGDAELRPFFEDTSVATLTRMQKEFFSAALDGPAITSDIDLARIHQGMGIRRHHLTRFVDHLITVLDRQGQISSADAMSIVYRIATYSDQIVEDSNEASG